jgi:predicted nucleic acid-binding protein
MDPQAVSRGTTLLLDTTVYIDQAKRARSPEAIAVLLADAPIRRSRLCIGELAFGYGNLDPAHPASPRNRSVVRAILARVPESSIVDLSAAGWARAGALAGILGRTQGFGRDQRRELLLDAAVFATAQEHGLTLLSGNIRHMDLLLQIGGPAHVLLYGL